MSEPFQEAIEAAITAIPPAVTVPGSTYNVGVRDDDVIPSPFCTLLYWGCWLVRTGRDADNVWEAWQRLITTATPLEQKRAYMRLPMMARNEIMRRQADAYAGQVAP